MHRCNHTNMEEHLADISWQNNSAIWVQPAFVMKEAARPYRRAL